MIEEPICTFDQTMLSACQAELKATPNPIIKEQCLQQESELLPQFAVHYQQLKGLRQRSRPSRDRSASQRALPLSGICSWAFSGIYTTTQTAHNG